MAERHTVDVDAVGSKPIRLPNKKTSEVSETSEVFYYSLPLRIPGRAWRIVVAALSKDEMGNAVFVNIHQQNPGFSRKPGFCFSLTQHQRL